MAEPPVDFNEAKLEQLEAAATYRVYGREIEFDGGATGDGATARQGWRLVRPCFCDPDSPRSPCLTDEARWWLRREDVVNEGNAERQHHDRQGVQFFDVRLDSRIMVESVQPVSAETVKRLEASVSPEEFGGLVSGTGWGAAVSLPCPSQWQCGLLVHQGRRRGFDGPFSTCVQCLLGIGE